MAPVGRERLQEKQKVVAAIQAQPNTSCSLGDAEGAKQCKTK
jgi:hypothetical protein